MRRHEQEGALSAEFITMVPLLLVLAAIAWQTLVIVGAGTSTATAARNGSRAMSTTDHPCAVVERSLPEWLRHDHEVRVFRRGTGGAQVDLTRVRCGVDETPSTRCETAGGSSVACDGVEVTVRVPVLFPGITSERFQLSRSAELPRTG